MENTENAMHFDDRLATVLRHRATGDRAARTQFRQLLDLLGNKAPKRDGERDESLIAAAWLRLGALGENIPANERAAMIREPGKRFRNPELAAHLAEDEPDVASAALSRAHLSEDDWEALIPRLPVRARGFLRLRRDLSENTKHLLERLGVHDRGLPYPIVDTVSQTEIELHAAPPPEITAPPIAANDLADQIARPEPAEEETAIGMLVKRIEAFRTARATAPENGPENVNAPRLPLNDTAFLTDLALPNGFSFTSNATGRVDWAEERFAPMMIGASLGMTTLSEQMRFRQPIRGARVTLEGGPLIAGNWVVDAAPRFTKPDGRFLGYAGMVRRSADNDEAGETSRESSEADRLRQLLHELRTPVNAIQGFSEVIQQQLFGPTPHEYRALAAGIAGDSARMLAGFDELDRLAKLETGALEIEAGESDFCAIVSQQIAQLQISLKARSASFELGTYANGLVPIVHGEAEAMAWRLVATLAGAVSAGEHLQLEVSANENTLTLSCELPATLAAKPDLFTASSSRSGSTLSAGMFGSGFSFRLVRAEAKAIGGVLAREDDWLSLTLPLLTDSGSEPSQSGVSNAG